MATHNKDGQEAENLVKVWLSGKGYVFKDANFRHSHSEIDLIFEYKGILVFVEVKYRSGTGYGYCEDFVDYTKKKLIIKAAEQYIFDKDWFKDIRFDIVGVYKDRFGNVNFRHFEDAFY